MILYRFWRYWSSNRRLQSLYKLKSTHEHRQNLLSGVSQVELYRIVRKVNIRQFHTVPERPWDYLEVIIGEVQHFQSLCLLEDFLRDFGNAVVRHVNFSDGGRQWCLRDDACDLIVAEVYLINRGEVEQLGREVYDLVVAEVDFLDALAVLEGGRKSF